MHSSALLIPLLLLQAGWLLAPGLLVALLLVQREKIKGYLAVPLAGLFGCVAGYGALWAYFAGHWLGNAYVVAFALLSLGSAGLLAVRRELRSALLHVDVAGPLLLLGLLALFYCSITFSCTIPATAGQINDFCHLYGITGDNYLPQIFADRIHHGDPRALTWDWQGSDRPPLQSGVQLLQAPLTEWPRWRTDSYEVLTVLLQALWLPALWALCRALRMPPRAIAPVAALCVCTGFLLFNSVFTWPKLLPAALVVLACVVLFFEPRGRWTWIIGGLAAGAALTAHGGVVFTLVPIGVALLLPRYRPSWAALGLTLLAALAMFAPWQAYQRLYDPPGDRLLKMHLAGIDDMTDHRPLGTALSQRYAGTTFGDIVHNKLLNLTTLFGSPNAGYRLLGLDPAGILRYQEFRVLVVAFLLLHLGWLALATRTNRHRLAASVDAGRLRLVFAIAGASLLVWVLLMFGPATTLLHQGSYATMLLLFAALGALLSTLPRWLIRTAVAVQALYWVVVWVALVWHPNHLHPGYVTLTVLSGAALAATLALLPRLAHPSPDLGRSTSPSRPALSAYFRARQRS